MDESGDVTGFEVVVRWNGDELGDAQTAQKLDGVVAERVGIVGL